MLRVSDLTLQGANGGIALCLTAMPLRVHVALATLPPKFMGGRRGDWHKQFYGIDAQILQPDPALSDYQFCHASPRFLVSGRSGNEGRYRREYQEGRLP